MHAPSLNTLVDALQPDLIAENDDNTPVVIQSSALISMLQLYVNIYTILCDFSGIFWKLIFPIGFLYFFAETLLPFASDDAAFAMGLP